MHLTLTRTRRAAAIGFGTVAVLILGFLTYLATQRGRTATVWVAHTYEVLATLEATLARTVDAETGVRGYIATGVPRFLDPYNGAAADVRANLQRLRRLTASDRAQLARLDTLERRVNVVFAHLDSLVGDAPTTPVAPRTATAALSAGKAFMDSVRSSVARIGAEERQALSARDAEDRRLSIVTEMSVGAETVAIAVCVLIVGLLLAGASRVQEAALKAEREARDEAERANRAKSELLSTVSHELRTPLNAISGYTDLLTLGVRGPLNEAQLNDIDRIRRANQVLTALVNDVLNFARLESGEVDYHLTDVPLDGVISDLETLVRPQFEMNGLTYTYRCANEHGEAPVVRADAEKLRQILLNLLSNAIKFTPRGGSVTLTCEPDEERHVMRLRVSDTGRGIPTDQLSRIFEPFVQIDRHLTPESQQGVGLGLAISRDLARGMRGELAATSRPGEGAVFTVTLPVVGRGP